MKQKSKKSASRRFKITKSGKVMRRLAFGRHLRATKSARQKRRYNIKAEVVGKLARRFKRMMALA